LNASGQLVGSISANFLFVLIEKEAWYSKSYPSAKDILVK
jgi:hypothetical protein